MFHSRMKRDMATTHPSPEAAAALPSGNLQLTATGAIRVSGADAESFLNAQLSNDLQRLTDDHSLLAAWCDAKGRTLAVMRLIRETEDCFLLLLPGELVADLLPRLKMFVLRARVSVADAGDSVRLVGLLGDTDVQWAGSKAVLPAEPGGLHREHGLAALRLPGDQPRYLLVADAGTDGDIALQPDHVIDANDWELAAIRAGQPRIVAATRDAFVPQMLNLHWLGGIDFEKGCYPGQEVVARLQYRGTLKRRLYRAETGAAAEPGDTVLGEDGTQEGTVLRAARAPAGNHELLAVIRVPAEERALTVAGESLRLLALPYATPA